MLDNFLKFKFSVFLFILLNCFYAPSSSALQSACRAWGSVEYLYGWLQDSPVGVPLVTQNTIPGSFGLINEPGTLVIFGAGSNRSSLNFNGMNGARVTAGGWIDSCNQLGLEASGFGLQTANSSFSASSVNNQTAPVVNIPFFSISPSPFSSSPTENVLVNKFPNTVTVNASFQTYGFELNSLYNLQTKIHFPVILLAGFRYLNINENFALNDAIFNIPSFSNSVINVHDDFATKNNFYGFQIGARTHLTYANLVLDCLAKIALGDNYQKLAIKGQTNINNVTVIQPIGIFTEPSNTGNFTKHQLAILPEIQVKLSYHISANVHPFVGYNCLYINKVIRPGNQIDRNINLTQNPLLGGAGVLTGTSAPAARFNNSGMWMQSVNAGIELSF